MSEQLNQYLWIAVAGGIVGFIYTFGIGANDVANACKYSKARCEYSDVHEFKVHTYNSYLFD